MIIFAKQVIALLLKSSSFIDDTTITNSRYTLGCLELFLQLIDHHFHDSTVAKISIKIIHTLILRLSINLSLLNCQEVTFFVTDTSLEAASKGLIFLPKVSPVISSILSSGHNYLMNELSNVLFPVLTSPTSRTEGVPFTTYLYLTAPPDASKYWNTFLKIFTQYFHSLA